jgi:hypothetical protein
MRARRLQQPFTPRSPPCGRTRCIRAAFFAVDPGEKNMHIVTNVGPLAALIAGILILAVPRLLNFIVALYLIIIGLLGLFGDHIR